MLTQSAKDMTQEDVILEPIATTLMSPTLSVKPSASSVFAAMKKDAKTGIQLESASNGDDRSATEVFSAFINILKKSMALLLEMIEELMKKEKERDLTQTNHHRHPKALNQQNLKGNQIQILFYTKECPS